MPARAGAAAVPGEGKAGAAARSPAAPGGGGSRRGAAPGLRPGEMRRGREAGEGGGGGRGRSRRAADQPCPAPSMSERLCISAAYARTLSSALRCGSCVVLLPVRPAFSRVLPWGSSGKRAVPSLDPPGTENRGFFFRWKKEQLKFV